MAPRREKNGTVLRARALRRDMTLPEGMLWQVLRQRPDGLKFRRQHPIGHCIVDFYCPSARTVVEVDGRATRWEINLFSMSAVTTGCRIRDCACFALLPPT